MHQPVNNDQGGYYVKAKSQHIDIPLVRIQRELTPYALKTITRTIKQKLPRYIRHLGRGRLSQWRGFPLVR
jgi:hypothetical protein